ncbi:DinB family protein [Kitasatospora sp. MAP5-34]|uniref:DinB family protein n=1 Tax=Kitasatospora sp. MAP5-34 TaxID=3035102 RepID=UPI0024760E00|nr:DinB family protein [Kitasatospora sp. MAP5-34]MDH6576673.1 putative damage-inducible protein DinB [Kitasatospora sp. MAP5-34]
MVTLVRPETDERDALLAFLDAQRGAIRRAAHGLTEEEAASKPSASALSLSGLVKHVARCEHFWIVGTLMGRPLGWPAGTSWADEHRLLEGESLAGWLKAYEVIAAETEEIIRGLPDLEVDAALPDQPWFPPNSRRTARWILTHLIAEVARHAGHADIIRETLDGRTAFELIADIKAEAEAGIQS